MEQHQISEMIWEENDNNCYESYQLNNNWNVAEEIPQRD